MLKVYLDRKRLYRRGRLYLGWRLSIGDREEFDSCWRWNTGMSLTDRSLSPAACFFLFFLQTESSLGAFRTRLCACRKRFRPRVVSGMQVWQCTDSVLPRRLGSRGRPWSRSPWSRPRSGSASFCRRRSRLWSDCNSLSLLAFGTFLCHPRRRRGHSRSGRPGHDQSIWHHASQRDPAVDSAKEPKGYACIRRRSRVSILYLPGDEQQRLLRLRILEHFLSHTSHRELHRNLQCRRLHTNLCYLQQHPSRRPSPLLPARHQTPLTKQQRPLHQHQDLLLPHLLAILEHTLQHLLPNRTIRSPRLPPPRRPRLDRKPHRTALHPPDPRRHARPIHLHQHRLRWRRRHRLPQRSLLGRQSRLAQRIRAQHRCTRLGARHKRLDPAGNPRGYHERQGRSYEGAGAEHRSIHERRRPAGPGLSRRLLWRASAVLGEGQGAVWSGRCVLLSYVRGEWEVGRGREGEAL